MAISRVFATVISSLLFFLNVNAQPAKNIVLITKEGFQPEIYLDASWNTTNLRYLIENSVYAQGIRGVFPTVTYRSNTIIITGAFQAQQGIYYNTPIGVVSARWNWYEEDNKALTLRKAVHYAHLTSAAVLWHVTVGTDIYYNIPEVWSMEKENDRVESMKVNTIPKGLWEEVGQNATGKLMYNDLNADYLQLARIL